MDVVYNDVGMRLPSFGSFGFNLTITVGAILQMHSSYNTGLFAPLISLILVSAKHSTYELSSTGKIQRVAGFCDVYTSRFKDTHRESGFQF
jgi:hypothetical protein